MPCRSGQSPDNNFDYDEVLYRRVLWTDIREDGHPYPESFVFCQGISVNRSRYSSAKCALCSRTSRNMKGASAEFAPFEMQVAKVQSDQRVLLTHTPKKKNASHCDIDAEIALQKEIRTRLANLAVRVSHIPDCEYFIPKE
jgi:hypothetical protein